MRKDIDLCRLEPIESFNQHKNYIQLTRQSNHKKKSSNLRKYKNKMLLLKMILMLKALS